MPKRSVSLLCLVSLLACHAAKSISSSTDPIESVTETAPIEQSVEREKTVSPTISQQSRASAPSTAEKNAVSVLVAPVPVPVQSKPHVSAAQEPPSPAKDAPVFAEEALIDTSDRKLHPYATLIPNPKAPQQDPWAYEQLKYGIYYSFIKVGTAYIRNRGLVNIDGRPAYLIQTTAFSASVIDTVFKVRDINQSWLDATDFYSHGYGQSVREGNYKRDEWLKFDYKHHQYTGQVQKKSAPKHISGPLPMKVLDMLTSLYYVRTQSLEPGKDVVLDIINREKQYPLLVKVLKKETIKTAAGKFKCIVVEPQLRGEGIFVSKGKNLKVWLTDDEYKMPVKMSVEVFIGSVSAELLAYQRQAPTNIL